MMRIVSKATALLFLAFVMFSAGSAGAATPTPRLKPPAPGPVYLSRLDYARLNALHASLKKKSFGLAKSEIAFIEDPIARSLGQWMYLTAKDPALNFIEAGAFLDDHAGWPSEARIQRFAELKIKNTASVDDVDRFFAKRSPVTGDGKLQLARARLAKGERESAKALIRDAWINHNYAASKERKILSAYGSYLSEEDHAARVDRMLWGIQVTNARRTFSKLSRAERRQAEARAALLMRASSAPRLFDNLSLSAQRDSGLLHAAVRYYRRTGEEPRAIELAKNAPTSSEEIRNPERWWTERRILAQWAIRNSRFADAYAMAAGHGATQGSVYSDGEFYAGWIALRFLNDPERAEVHFQAMVDGVSTPISLSRGFYWLGRAAAARGDDTQARVYYREAAQYHYSYYGQLAAEELGDTALERFFAEPPLASEAEKRRFGARPAAAGLRMLSDLGFDYEFMVFAYHLDGELESEGEYAELARLTNREGAPHLTVRAGKVAVQNDSFVADISYPLVFVPEEAKAFVAPEIILGLSRQESEFNPRAFSHAGARGMMQLIPSTAQITARKEGLPYMRSALLDDPVYNMTLGSAHLSHLLDRFDGSLIMTFAAYNAGAHRADRWAEEYGDPRTGEVDPLDWVEMIPFSETRNYVQRVLENVQVYRGRLNNGAIPGQLSKDLERGGTHGRAAKLAVPSRQLMTATTVQATSIAPLPAATLQRAEAFRIAFTRPEPTPQPTSPQSPMGNDLITPLVDDKVTEPVKKRRGRNRQFTVNKVEDTVPKAANVTVTSEEQTPIDASSIATPSQQIAEPSPVEQKIIENSAPANAPPAQAAETSEISLVLNEILSESTDVRPTVPLTTNTVTPPAALPAKSDAERAEDYIQETLAKVESDESGECMTYLRFLLTVAKDDATAEDLNAAALAELDGNTGC